MALPTSNLLARYTAGVGITNAGIGVSQWNDRSGNGHHATQGTDANRPIEKTINGVASVTFDGSKFLDLPGTLTINRQACSIFVCCRTRTDGTTRTLVHFDNNSTDLALYLAATTGTVRAAVFDGSSKGNTLRNGHGIQTVGCIGSAGGLDIILDGEVQTVAASSAGSYTSGFIGQWNGAAFRYVGEIYEIVIYSAALNSADRDAVRDYFTETWGATSRTSPLYVVFEGDSLTESSNNAPEADTAYPLKLATTGGITPIPKWFNDADGGNTIQGMNSQTLVATELGANSAYTDRVCVLWAGANDLNSARTSAQIIADIDTWIAAKQGLGAAVYVCTILPSTIQYDATEETRRLEVNSHIRTTATHNGYIDLTADARLSDPTNSTYYLVDEFHINEAGNAVVAELVLAKLVAGGHVTISGGQPLTKRRGGITHTLGASPLGSRRW